MNKFIVAWVILLSGQLATLAFAGTVHDAIVDFNKTSNTNSDPWSYRHEDPAQATGSRVAEPTLNDSFQPHYASHDPWTPGPDVQGWNNPSGEWPGILFNDTGSDQTFFGVIEVPNNTIYTSGMADGAGGSSVLSFLVPATGSYDIDFSMTSNHSGGGNGEEFFIDHHFDIGGAGQSQTLLATGTTEGGTTIDIPAGNFPEGTATANLAGQALTAGDRVNFVIGVKGDGSSDGVFLSATLMMTDGTLPSERAWKVDESGDWNVRGHWTPSGIPNANDQTVTFGGAITAPRVVFTEEDVTVKGITFLSGNTYAIAGTGSVNLEAGTPPANIGVLLGNHQFQAEVNLNSDTEVSVSTGTSLAFNNTLSLNGNTLTKSGGGELGIRNTLVTGGGTVNAQGGTVSGNGTVGGDLNNSGGIISPGDGAASLLAVPEPAAWLLLLGGILSVVSCRIRIKVA